MFDIVKLGVVKKIKEIFLKGFPIVFLLGYGVVAFSLVYLPI